MDTENTPTEETIPATVEGENALTENAATDIGPQDGAAPEDAPVNTIVADAPVTLTGEALIETLDKDGLEAFARENYGRELDKRKKLDKLRAEVVALYRGETQKAEIKAAVAEADALAKADGTKRPKTVRHRENGHEFPWNPLYAKNADLEVIEWE